MKIQFEVNASDASFVRTIMREAPDKYAALAMIHDQIIEGHITPKDVKYIKVIR